MKYLSFLPFIIFFLSCSDSEEKTSNLKQRTEEKIFKVDSFRHAILYEFENQKENSPFPRGKEIFCQPEFLKLKDLFSNCSLIYKSRDTKVKIRRTDKKSFYLLIDSTYSSNIISFDVAITPDKHCHIETINSVISYPDTLYICVMNIPIDGRPKRTN